MANLQQKKTRKARELFRGFKLSQMKAEIINFSDIQEYSAQCSFKESYTARASNSKILKNYHPMLGANKQDTS